VDRSKRQRRPRGTDPAPIHRRRHRIPARLNRRGTGEDGVMTYLRRKGALAAM
jgi:hypothetical protein